MSSNCLGHQRLIEPVRIGVLVLVMGMPNPPLSANRAVAEEALVAVAANFADAATQLENEFERISEHRLNVLIGSTGKLYAQITHGAPFDVLLAADQARPRLLETAGLAAPGSRRTYALGRLVLWSADASRIKGSGAQVLSSDSYRRLAIANPELAPYGVAAVETLRALSLADRVRDRVVMGENVGQAHAMVATGNAEVGFIAYSYLLKGKSGSSWEVPQHLYTPIRQDAVLLANGVGNTAAIAFLAFLESKQALRVIRSLGYGVD